MRVKFKRWAVDYLLTSKENQFDLFVEDKQKLSSFLSEKPTFIEIGPGKGDFIISMAAKNPNYNFIVIELNKTVAGICLKRIDESKLTNVKLVAGDFYRFVDQIGPKSIEGIFLNFSDPWPKHKHENRRLTSSRFLISYAFILKDEGKIYQKTDNIDLFNFSLENYALYKWKILSSDKEYNGLSEFDAETEFEHKFREAGLKINRCVVEKTKETLLEEIKDHEVRNIL